MFVRKSDTKPIANFKLFWEGVRSWPDWQVRTISVIIPGDDDSVSATFNQKTSPEKVQQLQLHILEDSWATWDSASGFTSAFKCTTECAHVMELTVRILRVHKETKNTLHDISIKIDKRPTEFQEGGFYHIHIKEMDSQIAASFEKFIVADTSSGLDGVHFLDLLQVTKEKLDQKLSGLMTSGMRIDQAENKAIVLVTKELTAQWGRRFSLEKLKHLLVEADSPTVRLQSDYTLSCMLERPVALKILAQAVALKG